MVKKTKKEKTKTNSSNGGVIKETFLNKAGKAVNISDIIETENDCWFLKKANAWILTHQAVKKMANIAGISKNYQVEESNNIVPDYKNDLEHVVRVTIKCNAKDGEEKDSCVHSDERELTVTGEANRINTPNRGRGYLRKMAEKRAYDIAVIEHLGLSSRVFSEEESPDFENTTHKEPVLMPGTQEFERIATEVNALLNAKSVAGLKKVAKKIKAGVKIKKYSEKQVEYLRSLYQIELGKKELDF